MCKKLVYFFIVLLVPLFCSCAGVQNIADYSKTQNDVAMSETVFLSPTDAPKTIYIQTRSTSTNPNAFSGTLVSEVKSRGYEQVSSPSLATYILQANIRYSGEYKEGMDFGGTMTGAGLGALSGLGLSGYDHRGSGTIAGGLVGAAVGLAFDAATRTKTFVVLVDIQITERLSAEQDVIGQQVQKTQTVLGTESSGGFGNKTNPFSTTATTKEVRSSKNGVNIYTTAVAAKAEQLNLSKVDPTEDLLRRIASQVAGIF